MTVYYIVGVSLEYYLFLRKKNFSSPDRFRTYTTQTMPIIEYYEQRDMVKRVSGEPPQEQV